MADLPMTRDRDVATLLLALVALVGGALVLLLAVDLFPYHSSNHDEGVYLQQARLLLDGRLWFETSLPGAFRWWFFVEDGGRLYGKYQPVVPALFAVGLAVGAPRLVLGVVAAGVVALVGLLAREAYDGPTGALAGALVVASPLFLLTTAVFLPYAPTALLNLFFAYGYVRLVRTGRLGWGILAGAAVGLAFFARPYTAILFAAPFVLHALALLWWARGDAAALRWRLRRLLPVAALGTAFVGVALAYNVVVTGDPLVFPYAAFAPHDGVGFGHREILGYAREYTVPLAVEANGHVLWEFATRFVAAPPIGALLAVLGVGLLRIRVTRAVRAPRIERAANAASRVAERREATSRASGEERPASHAVEGSEAAERASGETASRVARAPGTERAAGAVSSSGEERGRARRLSDVGLRVLLLGVFLSVVLGNVAFWGNLNALGDPNDPTDGFVAQFGPFYHYDLLLPLSAFGAAGLVWLARRTGAVVARWVGRRSSVGFDRRRVAAAVVALLLVSAPVLAVAEANALGPPLAENRAYTQRYESAYEPFEGRSFEEALVFVPTPYGPWLGHPFQSLQNEGGLDGDVVYTLDRSATGNFAVLDAFRNRTAYRFTFRGDWTQVPPEPVEAHLRPIDVREGSRHRIRFVTGAVGRPSRIRLSDGEQAVAYDLGSDVGEAVAVEWVVRPGVARIVSPDDRRRDAGFAANTSGSDRSIVEFTGSTRLTLAVTYVQPGGATVTYRQEVDVEERGDRVRLVWPPTVEICRLTPDCGDEGTYVPGGDYVDGVRVSQRVTSVPRNATGVSPSAIGVPPTDASR